MNFNVFKKSCPTCNSKLEMGFSRIRENIIRCSHCGALLIENPKRNFASMIVLFCGIFIASGSKWLNIPLFYGILIFVISFFIAMLITKMKEVKKELVIRNVQTNQISFINQSDWEDILNNSQNHENNFEIIEYLK